MCGIAGLIDWQGRPHGRLVGAMVGQLRHRGPDAQHVKALDAATLGHARLSVIDPASSSDQPMSDASGRYWIVFNGEIYNFQALRRELEQSGAQFRTRSDTEVILEAYKRWGENCVEHFNGMFAFALWDQSERRLFMARDRFGKKPLFFSLLPDGLIFASSPTALILHPGVSRQFNPAAIRQLVSLGYVLGSDCIYADIAKLEPGHHLTLEPGQSPRIERYWDLAPAFARKSRWSSVGEATEALGELVADAVALRMVSDVPLGAFLSGGVDSALIVAMMAEQGGKAPLKTFSAGFAQASFNEAPQARKVSAFLGTDHHDSLIEDDSVGDLPQLMECVGEPFADTSLLPSFRLSGFTRKSVTVSLTGDGGDELFAGYETYLADRLHGVMRHLPGPLLSWSERLLRACPPSFGKVSLDYKLRQFLAGLRLDFPHAHYSWRSLYAEPELGQLIRPDHWSGMQAADPFQRFQSFYDRVAGCHWLDQAAYVDVGTWLVDDVLVKVDRATMAHGLEARSPFLDYRVAEFAAALPVQMKLRMLTTKHILKKLHGRYYPDHLRPGPKRGFNAPIAYWFAGPQRSGARRLTESPFLQEWLEPAKIAALWQEHENRQRDNSFRLFSLACLGAWLDNQPNLPAAVTSENDLV